MIRRPIRPTSSHHIHCFVFFSEGPILTWSDILPCIIGTMSDIVSHNGLLVFLELRLVQKFFLLV